MSRRLRFLAPAALLALGCAMPVSAAAASVPAAVIAARSAILVDEATGRVLYERNADEPLPPASLAKLMTLHLVYQRLADRSISRSDVVSLSRNAWAASQAPGSRVIRLGPGQVVTVEELMRGAAIASGNDAAAALAEYVAGSVPEFVRRMNEEARFQGFTSMRFTDPSGVDPGNRVTAREFAGFCRLYVRLHPEALAELHSRREFDYPLPQNLPAEAISRPATQRQMNGNALVWENIGVDGLKTGHLDDENFTAAITARRGDTRLVAVLLGVPGSDMKAGVRARAEDGLALLRLGFGSYATVAIDPPAVPPVRVWKGTARGVAVAPRDAVRITLRADECDGLSVTPVLLDPVVAPVYRGEKLGDLVYASPVGEVARVPLVAGADVPEAGLLRRLWDGALLGASTVLGGARAFLSSVAGSVGGSPQGVAGLTVPTAAQ